MKHKHNIMVTLDGSDQSFAALQYISCLMASENCTITLLHILPEVPEAFLDLGVTPAFRSKMIDAAAWNRQMRLQAEEMMSKAMKLLHKTGYPKEAVDVQIRRLKSGIARDIIAAAQEGYDAVVLGRTGLNKIKDVLLGSIASKMIYKINHIPVVVVGGKPSPEKILIGFDGSKGSMNAVDCVCRLMRPQERDVKLCHVVRSVNLQLDIVQVLDKSESENWLSRHRKEIEKAFAAAEKKLKRSGFALDRIQHEIVENTISRAVAITKSARDGKYGTIVVGRRGLTAIESFFIGRVSQKVSNMAEKMAVWVV